MVNSLHGQGLDRIADGLQVEAISDDGVVEGVSMPGSTSFVAAVQWHAEYNVGNHPFNRALFEAFGHAARRRAAARGRRLNGSPESLQTIRDGYLSRRAP